MRQMRARSWSVVAAMATVAILAVGPLGAIDASATTLSFNQQGGFSFGSATWTNHGPSVSGVEYFGSAGFVVTDNTSPNFGQPTFQQIGWGCGNATSSVPQGSCAGLGTVAPKSPVSGSPPPTGFPTAFRSALDLDVFTGQVIVGGPFVDISSLQHYNRTIGQSANSLTRVDIDTLLSLNAIPPISGGDSDAGFVRIGFNETLNNAVPCPGGGPNPCADVFTFQQAILAPVIITIDGVQYQLEFQLFFPLTTFDELTGNTVANGVGPCPSLGAGFICTNENAISEVIVQMRVVALAVPAPASLLLLGFALSGLGVAGWLRRA